MLCAHFHFSYSVFFFCAALPLPRSHSLSVCWLRLYRCCASFFFLANVFLVGGVLSCAVWLQLIFTSSIFVRLTCSRETCFVFLIHSYIQCEWYFRRSLVKSYAKKKHTTKHLRTHFCCCCLSNWLVRSFRLFRLYCFAGVLLMLLLYSVIEQCLYTRCHCT